MRDKVKRFLSILMTALMLVNLLPVGALAEGVMISNSVQSIWWEPDTGTYNIYVYVMIEGEKSNFVENKSGWFTLGKISNVENMPNPKKLSIGVQTNKVSYSATALINGGNFSHNHNTGVPIDQVNWYRGHEECGFVVADGADDYPEATGKTWHLNGYIDASKVSVAYTIKYIDANTNQEIAAPVVKYGKPGEYVGVNRYDDLKEIEGYNRINYDKNREKLLIGYSPVFYVRYTKSNKTVPVRYEYQIGEDVTEITTQNVGIFTGDRLSNVSVSNEILKGYKVEGWYKVNDSGETSLNEKNATLTAKKAKTYLNSSNNGYYTLYQATTFRAKLVPKADLSYTVNYIDKDTGKAIINAKTVDKQEFGAVIESEKEKIEIDGYNYDSVDKNTLTIGTGENAITFYYTKRTDLSYTVNYIDKDTGKAIINAKTVDKQEFGAVIESEKEKIEIDGYNYDSVDKEKLTIGTGENVITFYYTKRTDLSYTVKYLEKGTNKKLHNAKTVENQTFGAEITSASEKIDIDGYNYDSVEPEEKLTIGTGENVINLYYTKQTNLSYKVNYLEQGTTNVLHEQKVQGEMTFDDVVKSEDEVIEINGYNYASADKETLTIGTGENVINLYYTKRTDLSYTVNYYWNGTTEKVADSKTEENQTFEDVIIEAPKLIEGYTPISLERQELIITTDDNDNTITFYYYKNVKLTANSDTLPYNGEEQSVSGYTCAVEEKQKDGSVEYVPWTGEKPLIFEGVSASGRGKDVNENGYPVTFNDTPIGVNDGLYYVNESQTGTLTITPRAVTLTSETAGKTYDGTALEKPVVTVGGDGFVEGQVKEIKATGSVTNAGSVANTITFTPNKETFKDGNYAITKTEGTLTIAKRSVLITSQSATKTYDGSALTRPAVTITGDGFVPGELAKAEATGSITNVGSTPNAIRYTTTGAFSAANYSIALSVGTLTVTEKPKPEPRRTFNLTINYVYQNGKRAAASYNRGGLKNGETFDITSPVIAGYTASETVVSGTIYNRDIKVTVIYTADGVNLDDYGVPLGLGNITMNVGDCFE